MSDLGDRLLWEAFKAGATYQYEADHTTGEALPPAAWEELLRRWHKAYREFYDVLEVMFPGV